MRYLIIGGTSVFGEGLAVRLLAKPDTELVIATKLPSEEQYMLDKLYWHDLDVRSETDVNRIVSQAKSDIIFDLATQDSVGYAWKNPIETVDINVSGISDVKVNIASCCMPIPGDNIVGYITKNNGITIHRENCSNLIHLEDRIVDVRFNEVTKNRYLTCILVSLKNNQNRLGDILNKISGKNLIVDSVQTIYKDNILNYKISLYVLNLDSLNKLMNDLMKLRYVKDVERV